MQVGFVFGSREVWLRAILLTYAICASDIALDGPYFDLGKTDFGVCKPDLDLGWPNISLCWFAKNFQLARYYPRSV